MPTGHPPDHSVRQPASRSGPIVRTLFRRADRGATIVEFALVAMPLLFLLFATIEMGLIFAANINLSNAMLSMARKVRVGAVVLPGMAVTSSSGAQLSLADFKSAVCNAFVLMPNATCLGQLQVDVRVMSDFGGAPPNPVSGKTFSSSGFCFYSGRPGSVVSMRAFLLWPVATPVLLPALSSITSINAGGGGMSSGNFFMLDANEAFVNEPNSKASNTGAGC